MEWPLAKFAEKPLELDRCFQVILEKNKSKYKNENN